MSKDREIRVCPAAVIESTLTFEEDFWGEHFHGRLGETKLLDGRNVPGRLREGFRNSGL